MPDYVPGSATTPASIGPSAFVYGSIETPGDHDWYRETLTAGESYVVSTSTTGTGDVDVDVDSYSDLETGSFRVGLAQGAALPVYSNDQIANQLSTAYWRSPHHFNVRAGGTLTYTIGGLTGNGQTLAREAFNIWSDATGLRFQEVSTGGQITIDDASSGASTQTTYSNGITSSATINIGTDWLASYGTSLTSYSFQTYVHEIGHALGLGHAGNYNDVADYDTDALYRNDSWSASVMSYFDQRENSYTAGLGYSRQYTLSPMVADAIATTSLYGGATTTRTGNTTYGFNNTSGRMIYDAGFNPAGGYTIYDNGGTDTLDYSGFSQAQTINLNAEALSNVGGGVGNVGIARGAVIENAIGGSGADTLIGNGAANALNGGAGNDKLIGGLGNDTLAGGSGGDIFLGTYAELNGDRITDFALGDRIQVYDAAIDGFSFLRSGSTLTVKNSFPSVLGVSVLGGTGTIDIGGYSGRLVAVASSDRGVDLLALKTATAGDFTGDGRSDLVFRNVNGAVSTWNVSGDGRQVQQSAFNASADTSWRIAEAFDMNGDGRTDILWRNANGAVAAWASNGSGLDQASYYHAPVSTAWRIAGAGDLNGDGKDDLFWQNDNGSISAWTSTGNGFQESTYNHGSPGGGWLVEGLGDFNGDGRADVLWRNTDGSVAMWTNNGAGTSFNEGAFYQPRLSTAWHIDGVGDFNGDGRDDILWRNDDGSVSVWRGNGSAFDQSVYNTKVSNDWHIAQVGDLNADGRADIVWRNDNGAVSTWHSNGGSFDQSVYNSRASTDWSIAGHDFVL